LVPLVRRKP